MTADTPTSTMAAPEDIALLRRAAAAMRERAAAATPSGQNPDGWCGGYGTRGDVMLFGGPTDGGYRTGSVFRFREDCEDCERPSPADFLHIESFADPAVALALADWLDAEARRREVIDRLRECSDWSVQASTLTRPEADAVARAYLREPAPDRYWWTHSVPPHALRCGPTVGTADQQPPVCSGCGRSPATWARGAAANQERGHSHA